MPSGSLKTLKPTSTWFIGSSLVGVGLLFVILVLMVQSTAGKPSENDVRARAGTATGIPITGKIVSVDAGAATVTVESMKMANSDAQLPGTWTAKTEKPEQLSTVKAENLVLMDVDPPTFSIDTHSFTVHSIDVLQ